MTGQPMVRGATRRLRRLAVAAALVASVFVTGPSQPLGAAVAAPADPYTDDSWFVGDAGFVMKPYGGYYYTFMMNRVAYQGPPNAPLRAPRVGEVFYVRVDTAMVFDRFADWMWYQMSVILPEGVRPALTTATPMYCYILKYSEATEHFEPEREFPGCAIEQFGVGYRFTNVQILTDESATVWLPVVATKTMTQSTMQLASDMTLGQTDVSVDPLISDVGLTVRAGTPSPPRDVTVQRGRRQATVSWSKPLLNGGSAITGYTARAFTQRSGGQKVGQCSTTSARTCAITGLRSGVRVFVDVVARNAIGTGGPSSPRVAATPT